MSCLDDGVAGSEQVQDFAAELWRIAPCMPTSPRVKGTQVNQTSSTKPRADQAWCGQLEGCLLARGPASGGELVQAPGGGLPTGALLDEALLGHGAYLDTAAASVVAGHTHRHHGRVQPRGPGPISPRTSSTPGLGCRCATRSPSLVTRFTACLHTACGSASTIALTSRPPPWARCSRPGAQSGPTRRRRLASDRPYVPAANARPPQRPPGPAARDR